MQHLRVTYRGQVQGVGFRWTVKALADSLALVGSVGNEVDGTVLVIVQGDRDRVARLMEGIDLKFAGYIERKEVQEIGALHIASSFEIRR